MNEYRFFLLHKVLVLTVNVLVLGALTWAMYCAAQSPDAFTLVFLKVFGGLLLPILFFGIVGKRALRRRAPAMCGDAA